MMETLAFIAALVLVAVLAYLSGRNDAEGRLIQENDTLKRVQHNLNALVLEQRHEIQSVDGLWATEQPRLIKHHKERELFFRIGYPKDRL